MKNVDIENEVRGPSGFHLRFIYGLSLLLISVVIVVGLFVDSYEANLFTQDSVAVNTLGKQRLLAQQIYVLALKELQTTDPVAESKIRERLERVLLDFRSVHNEMSRRDNAYNIDYQRYTELAKIKRKLDAVKQSLLHELKGFRLAEEQPEQDSALNKLQHLSNTYIRIMDYFLTQYANATKESIAEAEKSRRILKITFLFVLILLVLFVFEPVVRRNISLQKEREKSISELQLIRESFEVAVSGSNDGLWDWNMISGAVYYSNRFKELLGYDNESFPDIFDSWKNTLHPDDLKPTMKAIADHIEKQLPYDIEFRCLHKMVPTATFVQEGWLYGMIRASPCVWQVPSLI